MLTQTITQPSALNAGDSLAVSLAESERTAAAGWSATLRVIGQGANHQVAGASSASGWTFTALGGITSAWVPGTYSLVALLTKAGGDRVSVPGGVLTVRPDPAVSGTTTLDLRSPARRILDALQAAYESYLLTGQLASGYSIGTRSFQFHSLADLIKAIQQAKRDVAAEDAAAGHGLGGRILVRM